MSETSDNEYKSPSTAGIVRALLDRRIPTRPNDVDQSRTCLRRAIESEVNVNIIGALVDDRLKVMKKHSATDTAEETPLHRAARCGNLAIARKLIERGAGVNCKDVNGNAPLHLAVMDGKNDKLAELLLESGADVNGRNKSGRRPLSIAVEAPNVSSLVRLLMERGAYVNAHNEADLPLRKVILRGNFQLAKEMLAYGANVNNEAVVSLLLTLSWNVRESRDQWSIDGLTEERQFLLQHWIRLRAARLPYSQEHEIYGYHQVHRECLKEIRMMKDTFIDGCTSIYGFLHMDLGSRRSHVNNEKLRKLVRSPDLERQFPNYSVVILASYCETLVWKSLVEPAKRAWIRLTKIELPDECIERIFAYSRNEDLVSMIEHDEE